MKTILSVLFVTAITTGNLFAFRAPSMPGEYLPDVMLKSVTARGNLMPGPGPRRAVTTTFTFTTYACNPVSSQSFNVNVGLPLDPGFNPLFKRPTTVTFSYKKPFVDCSDLKEQEVEISTSKIPANSSIVIGNPVIVEKHFVY